MLKRSLISVVLALVFVVLMFWGMQALVMGNSGVLKTSEQIDFVDFVSIKRDNPPDEKVRPKPEPPPPPKQPPPPQKMEVQSEQPQEQAPTPMEIPNIGLNSAIKGGPAVGTFSPGQGGAGAGLFDGDIIPIARVQPDYPVAAQRQGIEGRVLLEIIVNPDGSVREAKVIESTPRGMFDAAAKRAVMRWKFKPKVVDGVPMAQRGTQPIDFTLAKE